MSQQTAVKFATYGNINARLKHIGNESVPKTIINDTISGVIDCVVEPLNSR